MGQIHEKLYSTWNLAHDFQTLQKLTAKVSPAALNTCITDVTVLLLSLFCMLLLKRKALPKALPLC